MTPEAKELKIFELRWIKQGEKEWMAARTNIEAIKTYLSITGTDIVDLDPEDEIVEIHRNEWGNYKIKNMDYDGDDWEYMTFEEWIEGRTEPDIIAGTMYE
jgi:hypothetical protein